MQLTIMSFNLKRNALGFGKNAWKRRRENVAALISAVAPDIIGTQELTPAMLEDMKGLLPEYAVCGSGRSKKHLGEHSAIFYKSELFSLIYERTFWLSKTPDRPGSRAWFELVPRICTHCVFEANAPGAARLSVYNTHLDHLSSLARINSLKLIRNNILAGAVRYGVLTVLMGDFNASPGSAALRAFEESEPQRRGLFMTNSYNLLVQSDPAKCRSYHGFRGKTFGTPIDYIFTSKSNHIDEIALDRTCSADGYPSDHYPVVARITLP